MKTNTPTAGLTWVAQLLIYIALLGMTLLWFSAYGQRRGIFPDEKPANLLIEKVRAAYTSQIGVREEAINSGRDIEKYLRYVKLPKGNPWCAAFVCWVFGQAGVENPKSGWSPDLFPGKRIIWKREQVYRSPSGPASRSLSDGNSPPVTAIPSPADIFGLYFPEKGRIAHVGFIDQWDGTWLVTVEGNTNNAGSREGDGVYRKRRLVKSLYRVARYIN